MLYKEVEAKCALINVSRQQIMTGSGQSQKIRSETDKSRYDTSIEGKGRKSAYHERTTVVQMQ